MPGPVFVSGDTVSLRTLEREDLSFLHEHRNCPDSAGRWVAFIRRTARS